MTRKSCLWGPPGQELPVGQETTADARMRMQAEKLERQLAPEVWVPAALAAAGLAERAALRVRQEGAVLVRRAQVPMVGQAVVVRQAAVVPRGAVARQAPAEALVQPMAEAVMVEMTAAPGALVQTVAEMRVWTATQERRR
jgi:hypothetical protein